MQPINWIFDHLWTLVIIAGVVMQLVQAIRGKKPGADSPEAETQPKEYEFEDPELAERTRRIREDIQRKIAERQRGGQPAEAAPVQPDFEARSEEPPPLVREVAYEAPMRSPSSSARLDQERAAEILEQQAAMAERLRQIEEMKAAAIRRAAYEAKTVSQEAQARQVRRGALLEDLRNPDALRRAFVLREVLGPPVGLR